MVTIALFTIPRNVVPKGQSPASDPCKPMNARCFSAPANIMNNSAIIRPDIHKGFNKFLTN